jgi:hypothetical protein
LNLGPELAGSAQHVRSLDLPGRYQANLASCRPCGKGYGDGRCQNPQMTHMQYRAHTATLANILASFIAAIGVVSPFVRPFNLLQEGRAAINNLLSFNASKNDATLDRWDKKAWLPPEVGGVRCAC